MIKNLKIQNEIIGNLELDFARVNIFIGHNGSGKSQILKAIAGSQVPEAGSEAVESQQSVVNYLPTPDSRLPAIFDYLYPIISEGKAVKPVYREIEHPLRGKLTEHDLNDPVVQAFMGDTTQMVEKEDFPTFPGRPAEYPKAMELLISIGADNLYKNDKGEYSFVFHNGKVRVPVSSVSDGDLRLFALLFELYFGKNEYQVWDEADSMIFPRNLNQVAINILWNSHPQFFIATNTLLLNYILAQTDHGRLWHRGKTLDFCEEGSVIKFDEYWYNGRFYLESDDIYYDPLAVEVAIRQTIVKIQNKKYIVLESWGHEPHMKNRILNWENIKKMAATEDYAQGVAQANDFLKSYIPENIHRNKIASLDEKEAFKYSMEHAAEIEILNEEIRNVRNEIVNRMPYLVPEDSSEFHKQIFLALNEVYYAIPDAVMVAEDINISVCYLSGSQTYEFQGHSFTNPAAIRTHRLNPAEIAEMAQMPYPFDMEEQFPNQEDRLKQ